MSAVNQHQRSASSAGTREKTYFEQQREALIGEIATVTSTRSALSLPTGLQSRALPT